MRDRFGAVVFSILNVLLFPGTLTGYVIRLGKGVLTRRGSGASATAQGPLSARRFQHKLGVGGDEPASRLMKAQPNVPLRGVRLVAGPMLLAHQVTGYVPKAFRYAFEGDVPPQHEAPARVTFFDAAVAQAAHRAAHPWARDGREPRLGRLRNREREVDWSPVIRSVVKEAGHATTAYRSGSPRGC
jgi:hypothetical protein